MSYDISVPGIIHVARVDTVADMVDALADAGFCKRMTVDRLCRIMDDLKDHGYYCATIPGESHTYFIKEVQA